MSGNFSFLVTGNVQGELYPKKMRRGSLGGLARRSTYINKVKKDMNPIILDAGNLFAENTMSFRTQICAKGFSSFEQKMTDLRNDKSPK